MSIFDFTAPEWMADAACAKADDPELWFADKGERGKVEAAKAICDMCPLATRTACLDYAIASEEMLLGIWGGTTERERRPMRRARGTGRKDRTHCRNDHLYTPETTAISARGFRICLTCKSEAEKRFRVKNGPYMTDEECELCGQARPLGNDRFCSRECAINWQRADQDFDPLTKRKPSRRSAARNAARKASVA